MSEPLEYILGIDLGSNSLGWAIIGLIDGEPAQLIRAGTRVFEAGMEGDLESGREESRNLKRREARLQRRQTWRRGRRLKKIFNLLVGFRLLPASDAADANLRLEIGKGGAESGSLRASGAADANLRLESSEGRQDFLNALDQRILASEWFKAKASSSQFPEPEQTLPYILRAAALDEPLEPHFLGRALYHLAQRRGFLSNRKQVSKKKDDDGGAVKQGIAELCEAMQEQSGHPQEQESGGPNRPRTAGPSQRDHVQSSARGRRKDAGQSHHVEIYAELDKNGKEGRWDGEVVSMLEAYQRIKAGKPVVQRDYGPLVRFKFSLAPGEVIECDDGRGGRALWVSRGVASYENGPRLLLVPLNDARKKKDILKAGLFWSPLLNPLRKLNPRKVVVSPLGEVSEAKE